MRAEQQDGNLIVFGVLCIPGFSVMVNGIRTHLKQHRKYHAFMEMSHRIKGNGTKIQGEVVNIIYTAESKHAVIRFNHEGRSITFDTPQITFRKLHSNDVTVYVSGSEYFADGFDGARII